MEEAGEDVLLLEDMLPDEEHGPAVSLLDPLGVKAEILGRPDVLPLALNGSLERIQRLHGTGQEADRRFIMQKA